MEMLCVCIRLYQCYSFKREIFLCSKGELFYEYTIKSNAKLPKLNDIHINLQNERMIVCDVFRVSSFGSNKQPCTQHLKGLLNRWYQKLVV